MSERNKELQKLFLNKEYSQIIEIIEGTDKEEKKSSALLNFLGVCKLLRKSKNKDDLVSANRTFLQAYKQEKTSPDGLKACINFINSSADIFDQNSLNNYISNALTLFLEANEYFGFNEKLLLAVIRIYKRQNNLNKVLVNLEKLIENNCSTPKILSSYIYRNCFLKGWSQKKFFFYTQELNKNLDKFTSDRLSFIKKVKEKKISIAFLSSDINGNHSITYFLKTVLQNYDKSKFKVYLISNSSEDDETTNFFKSLVDEFFNINHLEDKEAITYIRKKNISVLIDLMGLTSTNRISLLKSRISPIQVSWLGFCNTTGIDNMDYIFADENTIMDHEKDLYSEKIIYLPNIWNCHSGLKFNRVKNPVPFKKNNFITFGSFNNFNKINEDVVEVWSQILKEVHNSRLILKSSITMQTDILKNLFEKYKSQDSVIFVNKKNFNDHINFYNSIDIALDTFPYNGVTTSFEAIWMGVPVLTMKGYNFNSRCGESINKNLGLESLIAEDNSDYVLKAKELSGDLNKLINVRQHIYEKALDSPLFNVENFLKDFYKSLEEIYQKS